ncbi:MAG: hypothetical protein N4J56_007193 [Chroococcidiopsis sp. SAG 2025]|uniref:Mu transposase C-terminal domain-containing protein n=1 Tax=Chroococcidiopsis sp. SAG 2025 TaxID=171389 RepID=UPI00293705BD|nr:Mu transposase C-terminal domain-containing protein [Chroococcidiopsis sp. SAG 2025]MDV2997488.1 hypothetical protein [Chroococcidiopsis sp. SAG 2025]
MSMLSDRHRTDAQRWYSASELSGLPGMPAASHNVTRKAKLEGWKSRPRQGRGGGNEYAHYSLPAIAQTALNESNDRGKIAQTALPPTITDRSIATAQSPRRELRPQLKPTINDRTDAWLAILRLYETEIDHAHFKTHLERDVAFVDAYNQRQLELPNWVYAILPKLSRSSLKAKQKLRQTADRITALGGKYGHRRGTGKIDADFDLQAAIKTCLTTGGKHWGASQIYEILQLEFGLEPDRVSLGQLRDWLRRFRLQHPQEWALYLTPDRAKGLVSPAFGSRSQSVFYPNHVWEIDSMRVDINCKTEVAETVQLTRAFVIACVDVFTRRVMLYVTQHSNAEAVCLIIAAAILKWGVPEQIRTDRGKEYLSRRVQRFLANLGVDTEDLRCLPGHPEQKPFVERFNRTFQHRDLVKNPFFLGHNVSDRQTLRSSENRPAIELAMSIDEFQQWCDLWCVKYEQRSHGRPGIGLEGKSPLEVLSEATGQGWIQRTIQNPRELDFLMMAAPGKSAMRKVGRQGISVRGRLYVAAKLSTWIGRYVYVCFDPNEPRTVYVYNSAELTEFICQAVWRQAEDIDLAAIANQARHLYEVLLRSVNQIRKRGKALLHKLASDPYLPIGQTAQSLLQIIQSQIHDYPAIQAITEAIAAADSSSEDLPLAIDLETYHHELQRLEAESEKQAIQQEQQRSHQQQLEELVACWQQQQILPALEPSKLEKLIQHLSLPEGQGFLTAVTISPSEEQRFRDWLTGEAIAPVAIVDCRSLLETALAQWRTQQEMSWEDKQSLLHYIREPEGLGVLRAYTNASEEQHFQTWLEQGQRSSCVSN